MDESAGSHTSEVFDKQEKMEQKAGIEAACMQVVEEDDNDTRTTADAYSKEGKGSRSTKDNKDATTHLATKFGSLSRVPIFAVKTKVT